MYSIFLHFAAILIDLSACYVYFSKGYLVLGAVTSLITLFPLLTGGWLFYTGWTQRRQATIIIGFLHSGAQLLLQLTLLIRFWHYFKGVLVSFGTLYSPQWVIIVISCISSALVLAKSTRECHFLCQAPSRPPLLTASHFRAGVFFILHVSYRSLSLATILAHLPIWGIAIICLVFFIQNFLICLFVFKLSMFRSTFAPFTSLLTPSIFPSTRPLQSITIDKFHILNTFLTTFTIILSAIFTILFTPISLNGGAFTCLAADPPQHNSPSNQVLGLKILPQNLDQVVPGVKCGSDQDPLWILQSQVLPILICLGLIYNIIIVVVMGVIKPAWLRIPQSPSPPDSVKDSAYDSSRDIIPLEEEGALM